VEGDHQLYLLNVFLASVYQSLDMILVRSLHVKRLKIGYPIVFELDQVFEDIVDVLLSGHQLLQVLFYLFESQFKLRGSQHGSLLKDVAHLGERGLAYRLLFALLHILEDL
jgi:hypothetical protein